MNTKKAPSFDLATGEIKTKQLINASFRLKHGLKLWKVADVIMIPKVRKPLNKVKSCLYHYFKEAESYN